MKHIIVALLLACAINASAGTGKIIHRNKPYPNRYIVVLRGDVQDDLEVVIDDLIKAHGGEVVAKWRHVLHGFAFVGTEQQAAKISRDDRVDFVEQDGSVVASAVQGWNLDRVDNHMSPRLDGYYSWCTTGATVRAYVVDTGTWAGHDEFVDSSTGVSRVVRGYDFENAFYGYPHTETQPCGGTTYYYGSQGANDYSASHGTAVASVLGGKTMGTAPGVTIVPVRVLACQGLGYLMHIIDGLDWIPADPDRTSQARVVNMSWGLYVGYMYPNGVLATDTDLSSVDNAVQGLINAGITVVAAADNYNADASLYSPARLAAAITVGGTTGTHTADVDARWPSSNYGGALDIWAPGDGVTCAHWSSPTAVRTLYTSGTSFSAPLVAGVAARWLELYTGYNAAQITSLILNDATSGVHGLDIQDRKPGSPNLLIYKARERCRVCCAFP